MHVQRLALQLFDALGPRLGARRRASAICSPTAALLHDIGYHISYDKHHKHSYHLIMHAELLGMSPDGADRGRERRALPSRRGATKKHPSYGSARRSRLREQVMRLSAILRVADGLDRGHIWRGGSREGALAQQRASASRPCRATCISRCASRSGARSRKSQLLAKVAGVPVEIVAPTARVPRRQVERRPSVASAIELDASPPT